jgi:hypothetical protein
MKNPSSVNVLQKLKTKPNFMLENHSRYWASLNDPFNVRGAKIPDVGAIASTTFSSTFRTTLTADATYLGFAARLNLSSFGYAAWFQKGTMTSSTSISAWVNTSADPSGVLGNQDFFTGVRVVSASIAAEYAGTNFDNKGLFTAAFQNSKDSTSLTNVVSVANYFDAIQLPISKNRGVMVRYKPTDYDSFNYIDPTAFAAGSADSLGTLNIWGTGMIASTAVQIVVTVNYEGIPTTANFSLVQPTPGKADSLELETVMNHADEIEVATPDYSPASGHLQTAPILDTPDPSLQKVSKLSSTVKATPSVHFTPHQYFEIAQSVKTKAKAKAQMLESEAHQEKTWFEKILDFITGNAESLLPLAGKALALL